MFDAVLHLDHLKHECSGLFTTYLALLQGLFLHDLDAKD